MASSRARTFEEIAGLSKRRLDHVLRTGGRPRAADLVGFEFRGWNVNPTTILLGTRKFLKGFYRDGRGKSWGYNVRAVQDCMDDPWRALPSDDDPDRDHFFGLRDGRRVDDAKYPGALVVDYRLWDGTADIDPVRYTVDYLVHPDSGDRDLLLGKSYWQKGFLQVFLGFFVLARDRAHAFAGEAA